jgi:hypothetical protein
MLEHVLITKADSTLAEHAQVSGSAGKIKCLTESLPRTLTFTNGLSTAA